MGAVTQRLTRTEPPGLSQKFYRVPRHADTPLFVWPADLPLRGLLTSDATPFPTSPMPEVDSG